MVNLIYKKQWYCIPTEKSMSLVSFLFLFYCFYLHAIINFLQSIKKKKDSLRGRGEFLVLGGRI